VPLWGWGSASLADNYTRPRFSTDQHLRRTEGDFPIPHIDGDIRVSKHPRSAPSRPRRPHPRRRMAPGTEKPLMKTYREKDAPQAEVM